MPLGGRKILHNTYIATVLWNKRSYLIILGSNPLILISGVLYDWLLLDYNAPLGQSQISGQNCVFHVHVLDERVV